jgi:hypothetical protein
LTDVSSQTSSSDPVSVPSIEWQKDYYGDVEKASNLIQTIDGGYVFMDRGWGYQFTNTPSPVFKVDSSGDMQWNKTIEKLRALTIIQTNDEGYEIAGQRSTYGIGVAYEHTPTLIKMDSEGNVQWVANYSSVPDLGIASTEIHASDGGFAYWTYGAT